MLKFDEIIKLKDNLDNLEKRYDAYIESCAKELTARLLAKVIKRTPVGVYSDGHNGGTLRKGWTGGMNAAAYAKSCIVKKTGSSYTVEITNPVEYAEYVEYGHRTRDHKGWVPGRFMLTLSENEIQKDAPKIIEKKIKKMFEEIQNGK